MNNKIEITFELYSRFNSLRGIDTHTKFFEKLLDVYQESLKPKQSIVEANMGPNKDIVKRKRNSKKENSNG